MPSEIAKPTDGKFIQANQAEQGVDWTKSRVEHPAPDHTNDNHADNLGQEKRGAEKRKPWDWAAAQHRSQEEPDQDGDDTVKNDENQVVAQGVQEFWVGKHLNIVCDTNPNAVLAKTVPLVKAGSDSFENR